MTERKSTFAQSKARNYCKHQTFLKHELAAKSQMNVFRRNRTSTFTLEFTLMQRLLCCFALVTTCLTGGHKIALANETLPLILKEDFEHGFSRWQTTDPKGAEPVWKIVEAGTKGNHVLR